LNLFRYGWRKLSLKLRAVHIPRDLTRDLNPNGIIWLLLIVHASADIDAAHKYESKQTERFQAGGFEAARHSIDNKERTKICVRV
jgi:hypothetical protein